MTDESPDPASPPASPPPPGDAPGWGPGYPQAPGQPPPGYPPQQGYQPPPGYPAQQGYPPPPGYPPAGGWGPQGGPPPPGGYPPPSGPPPGYQQGGYQQPPVQAGYQQGYDLDQPASPPTRILVTTMNDVPGHRIERVYGEVFGLTVRARNIGSQLGAGLKSLAGGELKGMTKNLVVSRHEVVGRMVDEALAKGANAVVAMRFDTSEMGGNWTELCAYGTAVTIVPVTSEETDADEI